MASIRLWKDLLRCWLWHCQTFFLVHGKTCRPVSLERFSPSTPPFIHSYPVPHSANSWPGFSAFGWRQQLSLERRFGIRLGRRRKSGWRFWVYLFFPDRREPGFGDFQTLWHSINTAATKKSPLGWQDNSVGSMDYGAGSGFKFQFRHSFAGWSWTNDLANLYCSFLTTEIYMKYTYDST